MTVFIGLVVALVVSAFLKRGAATCARKTRRQPRKCISDKQRGRNPAVPASELLTYVPPA